MKKITFMLFALVAFCWQSSAQFTESFETEIPVSWTVIDNASTNSWVFDDAPSGGAQDGSGVAGILYDASNAHDDYLITPAISVSAGVNDRFSFYIKSRSGTFLEPYDVLLSTTDTAAESFTVELQANSEAPNEWTLVSFNLSTYVGETVYIAVHATGNNEFELYVDNAVSDAAPTCTAPTIDSSTVVDNCNPDGTGTFSVDIVVSDVGDAGSVFDDGTNTYPVVAGTVTAGPYNSGDSVTITVDATDDDCDSSLGDFTFTCPQPAPANDTFAGATPISPSAEGTGCDTFNFSNSTSGDGTTDSDLDSTCNDTDTGLDRFYTWTATTDALIWNDGSGNPGIAIRDAGTQAEITCAGTFADDNTILSGWTIGQDLVIQVYDFGTTDVDTSFCLELFTLPPPPSNIDCANAETIACGDTINASSIGSTGTQEDSGCTMGDNGIWYTFVGTGGDMTVSVDADFDHEVALTSGACGALVNVNCDDQSLGTESHTFASTLDETYYVYIAHWSDGDTTTGLIDITLTCAIIPDCTAPTIDSSMAVEDTCNPDGSGTFNVEIEVSDAGDAGTVFDDGTNTYPVVAGTVVAGPYNSGDSVTITVDATDDVCDSTLGTFEFTCPQPAPDNNDCAGATALTVGGSFEDNPVVGSNVGATGSGELPLPGCDSYDPDDASGFGGDVWYAVSVPSDGNLTVETQGNPVGNGGDTGIAVYTGTCGSLALFECNSDDSDDGFYSLIDIEAADGLADQVVYVRVWEFSGNAELNFQVSAYSSTLSTTDLDNPAAFTYFPNPVKNTLNLNAQNTIENVRMYNMLGQEVLRATPNNVDSELDLSNLQTGTYFVKVTIASVTKTIRVVKQ